MIVRSVPGHKSAVGNSYENDYTVFYIKIQGKKVFI